MVPLSHPRWSILTSVDETVGGEVFLVNSRGVSPLEGGQF